MGRRIFFVVCKTKQLFYLCNYENTQTHIHSLCSILLYYDAVLMSRLLRKYSLLNFVKLRQTLVNEVFRKSLC